MWSLPTVAARIRIAYESKITQYQLHASRYLLPPLHLGCLVFLAQMSLVLYSSMISHSEFVGWGTPMSRLIQTRRVSRRLNHKVSIWNGAFHTAGTGAPQTYKSIFFHLTIKDRREESPRPNRAQCRASQWSTPQPPHWVYYSTCWLMLKSFSWSGLYNKISHLIIVQGLRVLKKKQGQSDLPCDRVGECPQSNTILPKWGPIWRHDSSAPPSQVPKSTFIPAAQWINFTPSFTGQVIVKPECRRTRCMIGDLRWNGPASRLAALT